MSVTWQRHDHAIDGAAGEGKLVDQSHFARGVQAFDPYPGLHGEREQTVAREDGHGLAEYLVTGRLAAPEVVIVERRQIVVDQRVRVDHFEGASGGQPRRGHDPVTAAAA